MANYRSLITVAGAVRELPVGDLMLGAGLVKDSVDAGQVMTIPVGYQYITHGFEIVGTLDLAGKLVLL